MKIRNAFLFASILVTSVAFGQGNRMAKATIVVLADSSAGETMYHSRFRGPALDFEYVDSAKADAANRFSLAVYPDPHKEYRLQFGNKAIEYGIYLAAGDSLIFHYRSHRGD